MFKKFFIAMFSLTLVIWLGHDSVGAMESPSSELENEILTVESVEESNFIIEEVSSKEVVPFLSFSISSSSLGVNEFIKSNQSYYLPKEGKVNIT